MNLFLPEDTVYQSVKALDDRRLIKQILECKTILDVALDENKKGYAKHPVVAYYKEYPLFICGYGLVACVEYRKRFNKKHILEEYFWDKEHHPLIKENEEEPKPFYCEGAKTDPNGIRTTENTVELFRNKLPDRSFTNNRRAPYISLG